jgi:hypothetical protein
MTVNGRPGRELALPKAVEATEGLSADLLDANESTWAFVFVGRVGWNGILLVKSLVMLASIESRRSYCGRTADEHGGLPARNYSGMDRAGPITRKPIRTWVIGAVANCGNSWHMAGLTLGLSPGTLPKMGSVFDIAKGLSTPF